MRELAQIIETLPYGDYGFCFSEAIGALPTSEEEQPALPPWRAFSSLYFFSIGVMDVLFLAQPTSQSLVQTKSM